MTVGGAILAGGVFSAPQLPLTLVSLFLVAAGAATVSPPSTTLALVGYPHYAGTAATILGLARFTAGGIAAPLVGLAGPVSMVPLALVVLGAMVVAIIVYVALVHPAAMRERSRAMARCATRSSGRTRSCQPHHCDANARALSEHVATRIGTLSSTASPRCTTPRQSRSTLLGSHGTQRKSRSCWERQVRSGLLAPRSAQPCR